MNVNLETKPEAPQAPRPQSPPRRTVFRAITSEFRRFYYRVTRENIAGFLWTLAWTIPITVFIWVYAESELQDKDENQPLPIVVQSRDPSKIVTLLEPREGMITCDVSGPRSNVDQFKQQMLSPDAQPIQIVLDVHHVSDRQDISTLESLVDNSTFHDAGVTISNVKPANLVVSVDTVTKAMLPVRIPPNNQIMHPTFDPPSVTVTGPSKIISQMTEVRADLSTIQDINQAGPKSGNVRLVTDPQVSVQPTQVKVNLVVAEQEAKWTIPTIPVWTATSPELGYTITLNNTFVSQVPVIGPQEEIDALKKDSSAVIGVVKVGPENARNPTPLAVTIEGLPSDVRLNGSAPTVSFTATPQSH